MDATIYTDFNNSVALSSTWKQFLLIISAERTRQTLRINN